MKRFLLVLVALVLTGAVAAQTSLAPVTYQHLAVTTSLATSAPVTASEVGLARIVADVDIWVAVSGPNTTAGTSIPIFLPASTIGYLRLSPMNGAGLTDGRRALIFVGVSSGSIYINEMSQ